MAFGRPLQISLVGGSLASIAFRALEEAVGGTGEIGQYIQQSCPVCIPDEDSLHWPSFAWGLLIGFLAGPIIDFLFYLRVAWGRFVRARLFPVHSPAPLFRILS